MRSRGAALGSLLLALGALASAGWIPAGAAQPITATGGTCGGSLGWTNANQTIQVGDTVTWANCGGTVPGTAGNHTLQSESSGWCLADQAQSGTSGNPWSFQCKFTGAGTFHFQCGVHGSAMAGAITVMGAPPPPPPASHAPAPQPSQMASHAPASAAPAASPSASPVALATETPSPSPSESPSESPTAGVSGSSSSGSGPLVPIVIALLAIAAVSGGAFLYFRGRGA